MGKQPRVHLYVDNHVQGSIVKRVVAYWLACGLFLTLPLLFWQAYNEPQTFILFHIPGIVVRYWPMYALMMVMLPLTIWDSLRLSNRFVGPIIRMRRTLQQHNVGKDVGPIILRKNDFWHDLASELSKALENSRNEDGLSQPASQSTADQGKGSNEKKSTTAGQVGA